MRPTLSTFLVVFLIVIALTTWFTQVSPVFAGNPNATATPAPASLSLSLAPYTASAISAEHSFPAFDADGVVFIDTADNDQKTPYLAFETPKHTLDIKELLFLNNGQQPCQISAGEYPCASNIDGTDGPNSDQSPVPAGTAVHIVGAIDDQGIVVQSISTVSDTPTNMVRFATVLGDTTRLSNGFSVTPIQVFNDASCTLGVGCFGSDIERLQTTISSGNSTTTKELIPGTLFIYDGLTIIFLSLTDSGTSVAANFLIGTH